MKSLIVLISNPTAKGTTEKKIGQACSFLESRGYDVETLSTRERGDAEMFARESLNKSPAFILAAGGDGTCNEVANGIAGSKIPMAILPIGTANVLSKEFAVPEDVRGALEVAVTKTPKEISLGKIDSLHSAFPPRYFILMAGIGYDGETVFGINRTLKRLSGKGAYIYSGLRTLLGFHPSELTFNIDGTICSGYSAIIGKAAKYGGNFTVTPDAHPADPALYICLFHGGKGRDILRYVFGIAVKRHLGFQDVEYLKAENIEISGKAHVQIDGDYLGTTPVRIGTAKNIIRLIY
jgi:diacylglycerol kinase (ATP)